MVTTRTRRTFPARHARPRAWHPRLSLPISQTWMAGHGRAAATPFFERLCPAMTAETDVRRSYFQHPQAQCGAVAMMRMRHGNRERVRGIGGFRLGLGQQNLQHHQHLVLVGMAKTDPRALFPVLGLIW